MIGGLGIQELLVVLVIALFLFGGKKLPEVGKSLGRAIRGFKDGTEEGAREAEELKRESEEPSREDSSPQADSEKPGETPPG